VTESGIAPDPDPAGPAEQAAEEPYSTEEEDEVAARLEALGYLD
jgi:hypothetical protein